MTPPPAEGTTLGQADHSGLRRTAARPGPLRLVLRAAARRRPDHVRLRAGDAYKLARMGMSPAQIDNLIFTHHHFDHDVDYPCFLLSRWDIGSGQENRLSVLRPDADRAADRAHPGRGTSAPSPTTGSRGSITRSAFGRTQSRGRRAAEKAAQPGRYRHRPGPGDRRTALASHHGTRRARPAVPGLAGLPGRQRRGSFVFTGDTRPCPSVAELAKDADVLVFVCVGLQDEIDGKPEAEYMCGTTGAAELAQEAGAKKLVMVHNLFIAATAPWNAPSRTSPGSTTATSSSAKS